MAQQFRYIALTQQLDVLIKNKNLIYIDFDKTIALNVIEKIGYRTITKYLNFFNIRLSFNDVYKIYQFDSILKSETLRLIGLMERHLKTVIANTFVSNHRFDSYAYLDPNNFANYDLYDRYLNNLFTKLNCADNLPFWSLLDKLSLGDMLRFYSLLKNDDKEKIALVFNKNQIVFYRELKLIKKVRNVCAHFEDFLIKFDLDIKVNTNNEFILFFNKLKSWIPDEDEWIVVWNNLNSSLEKVKNSPVKNLIKKLFENVLKK